MFNEIKEDGCFANKFTHQSLLCLQESIKEEEIDERHCDFKPSTDLSQNAACYYKLKTLFLARDHISLGSFTSQTFLQA